MLRCAWHEILIKHCVAFGSLGFCLTHFVAFSFLGSSARSHFTTHALFRLSSLLQSPSDTPPSGGALRLAELNVVHDSDGEIDLVVLDT